LCDSLRGNEQNTYDPHSRLHFATLIICLLSFYPIDAGLSPRDQQARSYTARVAVNTKPYGEHPRVLTASPTPLCA
jgi:hypothetical protein